MKYVWILAVIVACAKTSFAMHDNGTRLLYLEELKFETSHDAVPESPHKKKKLTITSNDSTLNAAADANDHRHIAQAHPTQINGLATLLAGIAVHQSTPIALPAPAAIAADIKKYTCDVTNIEKMYLCRFEDCTKQFLSVYTRNSHEKSIQHTGQGQHKCPDGSCEKHYQGYARAADLRNHIGIHLGTALSCDVCGRTGFRPNNLRTHKRIHTGEQPYQCSFCPKRFGRSDALKTHENTHKRNMIIPLDNNGDLQLPNNNDNDDDDK